MSFLSTMRAIHSSLLPLGGAEEEDTSNAEWRIALGLHSAALIARLKGGKFSHFFRNDVACVAAERTLETMKGRKLWVHIHNGSVRWPLP